MNSSLSATKRVCSNLDCSLPFGPSCYGYHTNINGHSTLEAVMQIDGFADGIENLSDFVLCTPSNEATIKQRDFVRYRISGRRGHCRQFFHNHLRTREADFGITVRSPLNISDTRSLRMQHFDPERLAGRDLLGVRDPQSSSVLHDSTSNRLYGVLLPSSTPSTRTELRRP